MGGGRPDPPSEDIAFSSSAARCVARLRRDCDALPFLDARRRIPMTAPKSSGGASIDLRGVTKRYGEEKVVDSIDLSIKAGEFFSLLGPSGSGKSTTLMMIAGFAAVD